ncbi:hypothetical protein CERSUDRAFT_144899 [Gelatoporia subvermispora B]|uniref:DUF6535 domain-containing protein n=1 Tax=Ceriporiopsis subvermispora (strain B) TaxID=914234 RepID=M2P898_CERS8|nr:hypothetical protein CERSUDRAFT_144899 [Gelatoporia subvermispora B]
MPMLSKRPPSVNGDRPLTKDDLTCHCRREKPSVTTSFTEADDPWAQCAKQLREHDEDVTKRWKEEIDALLVFSGLFSSVLSAFIVESYGSLTPPSHPIAEDFLYQISLQLASLASGNITSPSDVPMIYSTPRTPSGPAPSSVWINFLWFSSLALSLATASIGIVVRQWLNHFVSPTSSDPQRSAYLHCLRYDRGLRAWGVPAIMSALPVLLQVALGLFLGGLVILMWTLNEAIAGAITFLVGCLFMFTVFTTVGPAIRSECPYKSPQALVFLWSMQSIFSSLPFRLFRRIITRKGTNDSVSAPSDSFSVDIPPSADDYSNTNYSTPPQGIVERLGIPASSLVGRLLIGDHPIMIVLNTWRRRVAAYAGHPGNRTSLTGWRAREHSLLSDNTPHKSLPNIMEWISANVLTCADAVLMEDSFLDTVVHPCISGPDEIIPAIRKCLNARVDNRRPLTQEGRRVLERMIVELAPRIALIGEEIQARSFLQDVCKQIDNSPNTDFARNSIASCAHLCSANFSFSFREGVAALLTSIARNLIRRDQWPALAATNHEPARSCLPAHDNIHFLIQHAQMQVSNPEINLDIDNSLSSCCVALHLVGQLPKSCYRTQFRADAFGLLNAAFKFSGSRSRRKTPIGKYWGAFFNGVTAVAARCEDSELLNRMRTEPGYVRYLSVRTVAPNIDGAK